jgi:hypothetical protein
VGVADDPFHTGEAGEILRRALGITAGYQNPGGWVFAMHAADGLPNVVIGGGGNGTGVEDDEIGGGTVVRGTETMGCEVSMDSGAIGLGGPAAEVLDVKRFRQATIIAF